MLGETEERTIKINKLMKPIIRAMEIAKVAKQIMAIIEAGSKSEVV
jgi:hypothetical protein